MAKKRTDFLDDDDEDAGIPWSGFKTAIYTWAGSQNEFPTVAQAAAAFNVEASVVYLAAKELYWAYINGDGNDPETDTFELDGE